MQLGLIGLGKMGGNRPERLRLDGHAIKRNRTLTV
jgi:6-phosphogluconate dehydrogenase (decarboxylating)